VISSHYLYNKKYAGIINVKDLKRVDMRIGICEDNKTHAELLQAMAYEWAKGKNVVCEISAFKSAESFLFSKEDIEPFDVLLLDIQMDKMTGIDLAKKLREQNDDVVIIFITAVKDYVFEGYDVNALNYILKPVKKEKLFECLNSAYKSVNTSEKHIIVNDTKIPVKSIAYVEAQAHYISIFTHDSEFAVKNPITAFFDELGEGFVFCHRSYIVNLGAVKQIKKEEVVLDSGKTVPVSRSKYKEVNEAFITYYKGINKL